MAEQAFVSNYLAVLNQHTVVYNNDYQQPPTQSLRKVPVLPVDLPEPPQRKQPEASSSAVLTLTFKSLKPPSTATLSVHPSDSIASIKEQLHTSPASKLLLKGKLLADNKLLKDYPVKDGDTITLMASTIVAPTPTKPNLSLDLDAPRLGVNLMLPTPDDTGKKNRSHQRIPSVVLSPSPSSVSPMSEKPQDIALMLDPTPPLVPEQSTYQAVIVQPKFWDKLAEFLKSEFPNQADANLAFEDFLRASKGELTASEIAKIRDETAHLGMAGT